MCIFHMYVLNSLIFDDFFLTFVSFLIYWNFPRTQQGAMCKCDKRVLKEEWDNTKRSHSDIGVLGAFAKLRKATISFVISVCPSVRMEQLGFQWTDFDEIWYLSFFFSKECWEN
jgi:hypothetical protein